MNQIFKMRTLVIILCLCLELISCIQWNYSTLEMTGKYCPRKDSCRQDILQTFRQSTKIFLGPPKSKKVLVQYYCSFFQYCNSSIGLFSITHCKVIALPTIVIAKVVALLDLQGDSEKFSVSFRYEFLQFEER